ncbi:hypothetical protein Tco_0908329 [Tanacetum coccineum]|uniref:Uncharacterized protein n=1 Tax=Tanacetum coccineum TaxID=301880 RepID=A0ABQ5CMW7_9ASTR
MDDSMDRCNAKMSLSVQQTPSLGLVDKSFSKTAKATVVMKEKKVARFKLYGFIDPVHLEKVYLIRKAYTGLKQGSECCSTNLHEILDHADAVNTRQKKRAGRNTVISHKMVRLGISPMIQPEQEESTQGHSIVRNSSPYKYEACSSKDIRITSCKDDKDKTKAQSFLECLLHSIAWDTQHLSLGDFGTDISQKDEKPSKKRQNRTRDGKVCEDEAQSKSRADYANLGNFIYKRKKGEKENEKKKDVEGLFFQHPVLLPYFYPATLHQPLDKTFPLTPHGHNAKLAIQGLRENTRKLRAMIYWGRVGPGDLSSVAGSMSFQQVPVKHQFLLLRIQAVSDLEDRRREKRGKKEWQEDKYSGEGLSVKVNVSSCEEDDEYGYFLFGRHLDELHVTWAHLEKKRTRLQTNTKTLEDLYSQSLETASQGIHDAVTTHQVMASQGIHDAVTT